MFKGNNMCVDKKFLFSLSMIFCLLLSSFSVNALALESELKSESAHITVASDFDDVSVGSWYYEAVNYVVSNGLFNGISDTEFSPNEYMTRGMLATAIGRDYEIIHDGSITGSSTFSDVSEDSYYTKYIGWAATNGIVNGVGNDSFLPEGNISRQDTVCMIYRYAELVGVDTTYNADKFDAYPDKNDVASYAVEAFSWAVDVGVINGSNGNLDPSGFLTRAQTAQIIYNFDHLDNGSSNHPVGITVLTVDQINNLFYQSDIEPEKGLAQIAHTDKSGLNDGICSPIIATTTNMSFMLTSVPGAVDYEVQMYAGSPGKGEPVSDSVTVDVNNGVSFSGLTVGQSYYVKVSSASLSTSSATVFYSVITY